MDASPRREVILPNQVEIMIETICRIKNQPPFDEFARKMLAKIGEDASVGLLEKILSGGPIRSFSAFVTFLVKKDCPVEAATLLNPHGSPQTLRMWSPSSPSSSSPHAPPRVINGESLQAPLSNSLPNSTVSKSHKRSPVSIRCDLSFEDGSQEKRSTVRRQSPSDELREMTQSKTISEQLIELSKLEFRKLFLVLNYIGRQKLVDVLSIEDAQKIYNMKDLPMKSFETIIWSNFGKKYCDRKDRSHYLNWDSEKTHFYYCYVSPDGSYNFKGPYLNSTKTHLQRSLGDDNVLIVKFLGEGEHNKGKIVEDGILVGLRRYQFFVFKDERKKVRKNQMEEEEKVICSFVKCYFVRIGSISGYEYDQDYVLSRKTISEARRLFMHIHTLTTIEKYMARFSLILSKTIKLDLDYGAIIVERIEDIPSQDEHGNIIQDVEGKPILHTDGTGFTHVRYHIPRTKTRHVYEMESPHTHQVKVNV